MDRDLFIECSSNSIEELSERLGEFRKDYREVIEITTASNGNFRSVRKIWEGKGLPEPRKYRWLLRRKMGINAELAKNDFVSISSLTTKDWIYFTTLQDPTSFCTDKVGWEILSKDEI